MGWSSWPEAVSRAAGADMDMAAAGAAEVDNGSAAVAAAEQAGHSSPADAGYNRNLRMSGPGPGFHNRCNMACFQYHHVKCIIYLLV